MFINVNNVLVNVVKVLQNVYGTSLNFQKFYFRHLIAGHVNF